MPVSKKTFVGGINQDDSDFLLDPKEYLGALNIRFATSENGEVGRVTNIEGNVEKNQTINSSGSTVSWSLPAGINRTIGAYEDSRNRRVIWFNWNSNFYHAIYCFDADTDLIYTVLMQRNNTNLLDFEESKLIHSVAMNGDVLYWSNNEPKRINVEAGIKMNHPTYNTSVAKYEAFSLYIANGGSGYVNGTYNNVPLTGGNGSGATANVIVSGGVVTSVTLVYGGTSYDAGNTLSASNTNLGGTGSGLSITITKIIEKQILTVARPQPAYPLIVSKAIDGTFQNNFTGSEAFQFSYRFVYRDNEVSAFSTLSKLIDYNTAAETTSGYNSINVSVPNSQWIDQDVIRVEFAVKFMNGGKLFMFKSVDGSSLSAHNGGTQITFKFFNDVAGVAIDNATSSKPYDSVPITAKTLEIAKNRLFIGNGVDGYNSPSITSLNIGSNSVTIGSVTGQWYKFVCRIGGVLATKYLIRVENITTDPGFYAPPTQPTLPLPATSVAIGTLTFIGSTTTSVAVYYGATLNDVISFLYQGVDRTVTGATLVNLAGKSVFKSGASYRSGVVFYDYAGRSCGVVASDSIKAVSPDRDYTGGSYIEKISWGLDSTNAVNEIPVWATHYSVVITKCLRTSFFFQLRADDVIKYVDKNPSTGVIDIGAVTTAYASTRYGMAIKVTSLFSNGLGYVYNEGDIARVSLSTGGTYNLAIKAQVGDYIITELVNLGTTTSVNVLYEVFTPYVQGATEFYYEVGETYKVNNSGTPSRQYSTVNGFFSGDVTILERTVGGNTFYVEAMSPLDKYWSNWYTDAGRPNVILDSRNTSKPDTIFFSNPFAAGTSINGLSTFDALDIFNVPQEMGGISRLVFTSKTTSDGTVMLAIGAQETASLYLGEAQIFDNTGASFLASQTGVIGNLNVLKGSLGTINPESAFEWQGNVAFFDANKGVWVRYDLSGLSQISSKKMSKYFRKVGQDILSYFKDPTEYNLSNPNLSLRVLGAVDPFHGEYLTSMPRMFLNPKNAVLEDMELSSQTYSFSTQLPGLTATPNTLSGFTYVLDGGPSASQSFTIAGVNLSPNGNVSVACSTSFEVSTDNVAFSCLAVLPYTGTGTFPANTFYVRMKAGVTDGSYSEFISITGGGSSATVSLSGTVTMPVTPYMIITPSTLGGMAYVEGSGPSNATSFLVRAGSLTPSSGNISIPSSSTWEFSTTSSTTGFSSAGTTIAYTSGTLASTTVWARLKSGLSVGTYNNTISITGGTASASLTLSGEVSDTEIITYTYPSGFGSRLSGACLYYANTPTNLYSTSSSIGVGTVLYTDSIRSTLLTGYSYVCVNGTVWLINSTTGTITAYSVTQC